MSYTMKDFQRDFLKEHFDELTPKEREEILRSRPLEERLAGLSVEEIQRYLERVKAVPSQGGKVAENM